MASTVIITYLQMLDRSELLEKSCADPEIEIREATVKQWQVNKGFYQMVGQAWHWFDRYVWTDEQWREYAESEQIRLFIAYKGGSPAGYYELRKDADGAVEIVCLGLLPKFIGGGCGGFLISQAIRSGWEWDASRVWLNTCTLDHPNALNAYTKCGLKSYKRVEKTVE